MKRIGFFIVLVIALIIALDSAQVVNAQKPNPQATVIPAVKQGIGSLPFNSRVAIPSNTNPRDVPSGRLNPSLILGKVPSVLIPQIDGALQIGLGSARMPLPLVTFEGMSRSGLIGNFIPPDTNGDIGYAPATGKKYYAQIVNSGFQVWDVTSTPTLVLGPVYLGSLWNSLGAPCNTNAVDPIVLFDTLANRWLISQFPHPKLGSFVGYHQCIAISKSSDPTGEYYLYDFIVHMTKMNDYPKFGVWHDGYYMSVNQFYSDDSWAGAGAYVFDRAKMLAGNPATAQYFDLPNLGGMLPSHLNGTTAPPAGAPNYFLQVDDDPANVNDRLELWQFHVDWTTPANSTFTNPISPTVATFSSNLCGMNYCISQLGVPLVLDPITLANDVPWRPQLMYRLNYRNFGTHESLVVNHTVSVGDSAYHAGIRWYELRKNGGAWSVYQQGTYAPDSNSRWMGSIAMDGHGNIALGYSV